MRASSSRLWGRLHEAEVGPRLGVAVGALDGGLQPFDLASVGSGEDHEVRVASRVQGGSQFQDHLLSRDHLLTLEVPAALRRDLVLEQEAGSSGPLGLPHGAHDVVQVAMPGIAVGHDWHVDAQSHPPHDVGDLAEGQESDVRQAQQAAGDAESPRQDELDPGQLDQPGAEDVIRSQTANDPGLGQQFSQPRHTSHETASPPVWRSGHRPSP